MYRTDSHNNPTAFTTDVAKEARLTPGIDYTQGDPFTVPGATPITLHTARLLKDPIQTTVRVIDALSFLTRNGISRWGYITMPKFTWDSLTISQKRDVIGWMYQFEGGQSMKNLFPNYGKP